MRHGPRDRKRPGLVPAPASRSGPACEIDERGAIAIAGCGTMTGQMPTPPGARARARRSEEDEPRVVVEPR